MNKLCVVLMAVCLVAVQAATVKRETTGESQFKDIQDKWKDMTKNAGDALAKAFDPKTIQDNLEKSLASMQQAFESIKQKVEGDPKKPDAPAAAP